MIYILLYSMRIHTNYGVSYVSGLFENAYNNIAEAEKAFNDMIISEQYFRKELWAKDNSEKMKLLKETSYYNG